MGRKRGFGRGGANAPGGGAGPRVMASSPVPLSPAEVFGAAAYRYVARGSHLFNGCSETHHLLSDLVEAEA